MRPACRLPYELIDENGRSLSPAGRERALCPRDTNTSQLVRRLYDAGAASLKLEGRMKAPDYVYSIVDVYRHQIDDMLADVSTSKDEDAPASDSSSAALTATLRTPTKTVPRATR